MASSVFQSGFYIPCWVGSEYELENCSHNKTVADQISQLQPIRFVSSWHAPYLDEVLHGLGDGLHRPLEIGHVVSGLALLMNDHQSGDLKEQ